MKVKVRKGRELDEVHQPSDTQRVAAKGRDHAVAGTAAAAAAGGAGRTPGEDRVVVVAMKMDAPSRELLTWALVKVARPGDRVFAVHVLPNPTTPSLLSNAGGNPSSSLSLLKLVRGFDNVLAVYEGFCNLKQIDLKLKLCRDSSVRKALVREAAQLQASHLILGVNADTHGFRSSSTSVARYCARKLPPCCSVTALDSGKVVFQRTDPRSRDTSDDRATGDGRAGACDSESTPASAERDIRPLHCFLAAGVNHGHRHSPCIDANYKKSPLSNAATNRSSSWSSPTATTATSDAGTQSGSPHSDDANNPLAMVPVPDSQATTTTPRSISVLIRDLTEPKPGWPLLRRAVLQNNKAKAAASAAANSSKISVVQWVMQLPDRFPPDSPRHPDHKPDGTEATVARECSHSDEDDDDDGALVQAATDVHSGHLEERVVSKDHQQQPPPKLRKELESLRTKYGPVCRLYDYHELADATSNFSTGNLIGKGGSSHVYRGCLPGGREMAVKMMKPTDDARKEFALEIEMITALHHTNIITLLGFCVDDSSLLLVYDFLSRGSLEDNLHGEKHRKSEFRWPHRCKVAVGVAEALQHLHTGGSTRPVIHRDVKSSNILLSDDFEPRLSDFGLATWVSSASSHITCTDVAGTFGYLAPEYFMFGKVNEKIDVYAFGVVLLELLSGKKPIGDEYPKGQESLVMWAKPILQSEQLSQLMDASLDGQYDEDQAEVMMLAASLCLRRSPQLRPKMDLVLKLLKGDRSLIKWARLKIKCMKDPGQELDDEADIKYLASDFRSHLNLALLDVEDDALSVSSTEHSIGDIMARGSLEAYLQGRWSRSSSFD